MDISTTTTNSTYVDDKEDLKENIVIPLSVFVIIEYCIVTTIFVFAVFGIFTNIVNILVFRRQGVFSNSAIVSLSALCVSDFCYCILSILPLPFAVARNKLDWRLDVRHYEIFTMRPGDLFSQITCWVTAYAAFERMFSVVWPFKVKTIFSSQRSFVAIVCLYVGFFMLTFPNLIEQIPGWFTNDMNETAYGPRLVPLDYLLVYHNSVIVLRVASVVIVVLCNCIIFYIVNLSQKFRRGAGHASLSKNNMAASESEGDNKDGTTSAHTASSKETVLLRMTMVISAVFTVCYTMNVVYFLVFVVVYEFYLDDYYYILDDLGFEVTMMFQVINSSTNIIIYYTLSSRYREEFSNVFKKKSLK